MLTQAYILAIDQGTTSSRAMVFDKTGTSIAVSQEEFPQIYPQDGWVEHDPEAIWNTTLNACKEVLNKVNSNVVTIGITNQRETTILWDKITGEPIYNAIVWQDRRTASLCETFKNQGHEETIIAKTGLLLDPYFSATKICWILDNVENARERAERGELAFGTIDSFLLWRLTGGKSHATDATNASRTMLYNIHKNRWDTELLELFGIPASLLPEVKSCADDFGLTSRDVLGAAIPIEGIAGDQQAASIGQACFTPGMMKSTYGTGCFLLLNTGKEAFTSKHRLLTTIAYRLNDETTYALEGSVFIAGAAIQWLRDKLNIITSAKETEAMAASLDSNKGVYIVPAFTGLGCPHWNPHTRGTIFGLTRDTGRAEIVRATLESIAYQTQDLLYAMEQDGVQATCLRADGGMVQNNWFMQFLSDITDTQITRPIVNETTALGAAYLAGLQHGIYTSLEDITKHWQENHLFTPSMEGKERNTLLSNWSKAVKATCKFYSSKE